MTPAEARALTAKGAATRARIVEGAAALIRERGPAATSLEDVLAATSTGKSQLFHYFPQGRDELLRAVAEHEADHVLAAQEPHLSNLTSWRRWLAWRRAVIVHYAELGSRCPLGALTAQLGKSSPETREIVSALFETWEARLLAGVEAIAARQGLPRGLRAPDVARAILAAIQGGVVVLQVTGDVRFLEAGLDVALRPLAPGRAAT
jgi:AcrR family transcriptional regulator